MKYAGLLVMPAGFFLTIAALALFPDPARRLASVLCGLAVIGMGLVVDLLYAWLDPRVIVRNTG